ncbi:unnamed protein product [Dracunculus medinensis]|uniref:Ground-like domain-containing protein n=1 Tax=Dracunculus medinensis TaxID=318479 RepID=A0A0N4U0Y5_DRAME|nr:unnamed protein product [Dracunculus medinensis]
MGTITYDQQPFNLDRCNSKRLYQIVIDNIVQNDIESTKRKIQILSQQAFGNLYNVICGTGFFSYIVHTDEYCLISFNHINCYVFSLLCSSSDNAKTIFSKIKKLNKN